MMAKQPTSVIYELMVKSLLDTRFAGDGLSELRSFHLKKYRGKSGQEHEIDVSFEITIGQLSLLLLVECKEYTRKVGLDDIMAFSYRIRDIGANKGLFVTTAGFQSGAFRVAAAEGIGLLIAVRGEIVSKWGYFTGKVDYSQFGIVGFELAISEDNLGVNMIGRRLVAGNEEWRPTRIDLTVPLKSEEALMFLMPDEESLLLDDSSQLRSGAEAQVENRTWSRPLRNPNDVDHALII